jgi:YVTN family beta-propeller protein
VIATASNTVVATVPVGKSPLGVAITPDGNHVYVANNFSNYPARSQTVSVIETTGNTVMTTVAVGSFPFGVPSPGREPRLRRE